MKVKKLKYYGGDGYDDMPEDGNYEVKYGGDEDKIKEFKKLSQALKFYEPLQESKALWDVSAIPELLDCWYEA